jgi:putative thioredoxin
LPVQDACTSATARHVGTAGSDNLLNALACRLRHRAGNMTMPHSKAPYQWIFDVDYENFDSRVIEPSHERPILVDLWADWCSPCQVLTPVLMRIVEEFGGRLHLAKVEVDEGENMKLAGHYHVRGFPTVILFEQGSERARFSGARHVHAVREFLEQNSRLLEY